MNFPNLAVRAESYSTRQREQQAREAHNILYHPLLYGSYLGEAMRSCGWLTAEIAEMTTPSVKAVVKAIDDGHDINSYELLSLGCHLGLLNTIKR